MTVRDAIKKVDFKKDDIVSCKIWFGFGEIFFDVKKFEGKTCVIQPQLSEKIAETILNVEVKNSKIEQFGNFIKISIDLKLEHALMYIPV